MYSPVKKAVTAALLKVLEVWMPSQLMCAAAFGQGGATVRFTNVFSNTYACVATSHFLVEVVSSSRSSTACLQWRCRILEMHCGSNANQAFKAPAPSRGTFLILLLSDSRQSEIRRCHFC
ncbi:hypothetical protein M758_5G023700 [Ceratodon purpureus]|nr:hypothetical protein M758_5G023700 [Ceratodon purpureus]